MASPHTALQELAEHVVRSIVRNVEQVRLVVNERKTSVDIQIFVADKDRGAIIGRGGKTLNALVSALSFVHKGKLIRIKVEG